MSMTIKDPNVADQIRRERAAAGLDKYDEVWDGETVVMPLPNDAHQALLEGLAYVLAAVFGWPNPHRLRPGINLSDRDVDWLHNFREPDFAVFLEGNFAQRGGVGGELRKASEIGIERPWFAAAPEDFHFDAN